MAHTYDPLSFLPSITRMMCAGATGALLAIGMTSIAAGQFADLIWLALLPVAERTRQSIWSNV